MTKDEALKLALEAFEAIPEEIEGWVPDKCTDAVIAIREALAQPEQEPVAVARVDDLERGGRVRALAMGLSLDAPLYTSPQPAQQQEPVALPEKIYEFVPTPEPAKWHHPECEGACIACLIEQVVQEAYGSQGLGYLQRHLTAPPHRKPLTDEEILSIARNHYNPHERSEISFARAIEAKLREKNT